MKNNPVSKSLRSIDGGVCAPKGFVAGGVRVALSAEEGRHSKENVALIVSRRYCTAAFESLGGKALGACAAANKKHLQMQYARAVFLNGELALMKKADMHTVERVCFEVGKGIQIPDEEVFLVTCGKMGKSPSVGALVEGVKRSFQALIGGEDGSSCAARAISTDGVGQSLAYSFALGDYPCRIGAVFAGDTATSCALTTDAKISAEMLRKALATAVKDTFDLLQHKGENSPNDTVCILASGDAGNYCISQEDSEYEKFLFALESVLHGVCKALAQEKGTRRLLTCFVENAKSKRVSRAMAKSVVHSPLIKEDLRGGKFPLDGVLNALNGGGEPFDLSKLSVTLRSAAGEFLLYDDGSAMPYEEEVIRRIVSDGGLEICVDCKRGNYDSTAYGGF